MPPSIRSFGNRSRNDGFTFNVTVDMGDLESLPDRLTDAFNKALMFHLADAAQRVIDTTRHYLVRLNEAPVKYNLDGIGIHGYDTGLMYVSLRYELALSFLASGVFYELLSDEAKYWRYVEFGFHRADGSFWPGYHMLETAIEDNAGYIRQRVREAWHDTAIALALEAHVPGGIGRLGFTG